MSTLEKTLLGMGVVVLVMIFAFGVTILGSIFTWWAWNTFMVAVFHLPTINIWQAIAFNFLAGCFRSYSYNAK